MMTKPPRSGPVHSLTVTTLSYGTALVKSLSSRLQAEKLKHTFEHFSGGGCRSREERFFVARHRKNACGLSSSVAPRAAGAVLVPTPTGAALFCAFRNG